MSLRERRLWAEDKLVKGGGGGSEYGLWGSREGYGK